MIVVLTFIYIQEPTKEHKMFDLNYYNEITDFGKVCDKILSEVKVQGMQNNQPYLNKTDKKVKLTGRKEQFMNDIMHFHNKYGAEYYKWYIRYFEKDTVYVDRHTNNCNQTVVLKKLVKRHHYSNE